MSKDELGPPSPEMESLLAAERERPGPPSSASSRVWNRLEASIAIGAPPPPGADGAPAGAATSTAGTGAGIVGAASGPAVKILMAGLAPATVAALAVGGAIWMADQGKQQPPVPSRTVTQAAPLGADPPPPPTAEPEAPLKPTIPTPTAVAISTRAEPEEEKTRTRRRRTVAAAAPRPEVPPVSTAIAPPPPPQPSQTEDPEVTASSDDSLAAERALLETARLALLAGEPARARVLLATHRERFKPARLAEQRESLFIQTLAAGGNVEGARQRLEDFRRRYPRSIFLPVLEAALVERKRP